MTTDLIRRTLQPLLDEKEKMDGIVSDLEEELAEAKQERKIVEKLLIDGGLIERPEAKTNGSKPRTGKDPGSISEEMLDRAREAIETTPALRDDEFRNADLREAMGVAEATANKAIVRLRETGEVRLVGKRGQANYYRAVEAS
jgi:predicted transcriptional regulator